MNYRMIASTVVMSLVALCPSPAAGRALPHDQPSDANKKPFVFEMLGLCCDKTTEPGADEVYFLSSAQYSNKSATGMRLPADAAHKDEGHWDMNDNPKGPEDPPNGDAHCRGTERNPKRLFAGELAPGESVSITVWIMEEDLGKDGKSLSEIVKDVSSKLPIPGVRESAEFLARVFQVANFKVDSDDFIGSFQVRISRGQSADSGFNTQWSRFERVADEQADNRDPNNNGKRVFWLNGDGSKYRFWGSVH